MLAPLRSHPSVDKVKAVNIDASELRSLDYCGTVPVESLLSLHGMLGTPSCTVDFCVAYSKETHFDGLRRFMEKISDAKNLHHRSLESSFFLGFPSFSNLMRLVLEGPLNSRATVVSVGRILEQTPNLEVLSLYMERVADVQEEDIDEYEHDVDEDEEDVEEEDMDVDGIEENEQEEDVDEDEHDAGDEEENDLSISPNQFMVPEGSSFSMPCLRHRVKEINMVHYHGDNTQRMMAWLLFRNALVLERMCVVLVRGTPALQSKLKNKIDSWVVADAEKIFL